VKINITLKDEKQIAKLAKRIESAKMFFNEIT